MIIIHIGSLMFPFPTVFLEFLAGEFYRKFSETCSRMVISQKDMIAYHEHAVEASNSHLPMLDAVSSEFWEPKIVRKSNGADIYRLQRKVKKRDMLGLYKYGFEREKTCYNLIALVTESTGGENIRDLRSILHWLRHGEED
ncbi:unnamed protein product [Brassica oleracea]|uniref:(rape) hypothetical protein n=1 Tax=Brassica napus TaxID=3708 RepID=A0A816JWW2_BRANA|nr:unnamed protein product [Brassica napus]